MYLAGASVYFCLDLRDLSCSHRLRVATLRSTTVKEVQMLRCRLVNRGVHMADFTQHDRRLDAHRSDHSHLSRMKALWDRQIFQANRRQNQKDTDRWSRTNRQKHEDLKSNVALWCDFFEAHRCIRTDCIRVLKASNMWPQAETNPASLTNRHLIFISFKGSCQQVIFVQNGFERYVLQAIDGGTGETRRKKDWRN